MNMKNANNNGCKNCKYAPTTFEEYNMVDGYSCPNAYTEKARHCGNYEKSKAESEVTNETDN